MTPPPDTSWNPDKQKVEAWALAQSLNHYEVLDANENASDSELGKRIVVLKRRLKTWESNGLDAKLQEIGRAGNHRLELLEQALADRAAYNEVVKQERHQRAVLKIAQQAADAAADKILQFDEWMGIKIAAESEGVSPQELEDIILKLKGEGVLTGVTVAGQEVRSVDELKRACNGRAHRIVDILWNRELEQWLQLACKKVELAEQTRQIRADYEKNKRLGAHLWLWNVGEKRLVLSSSIGEEEISTVRDWVAGIKTQRLLESSVEALEDGRLENWFNVALNREEFADLAAKEKGKGAPGLANLAQQLVAIFTGQLGNRTPFKFKRGEATSVPELIQLCDTHVNEAMGYFSKNGIQGWMVKSLGEGALEADASQEAGKYSDEPRKAMELFVRKLCEAVNLNPYPQIVAEPNAISLGELPMGAQTSCAIKLSNWGRGYAWGNVQLDPPLPGLSVTKDFDGLDALIDLTLDTVKVQPGFYATQIIVAAAEGPEPCVIPVQYVVVPLTVSIYPPVLDFGAIPLGKSRSATLQISGSPSGGRLVGKATVNTPKNGLTVTRQIDGLACTLQISLATAALEAGRTYKTAIALKTNVGEFQVPVEFHTQLRWDIVTMWTVGVSLSVGLFMFLCRLTLASVGKALGTWLTSYGDKPNPEALIPSGLFAVVLGGVIWSLVAYKRSKT